MTDYLHTKEGVEVAYDFVNGGASLPAVVYHPGFLGTRNGIHAECMSEVARRFNMSFLTLDNAAQGESSGRFSDHGITSMRKIATEVIDKVIPKDLPLVFVGNSFGSEVMSGVAAHFPDRISGYIGISALHASHDIILSQVRQAMDSDDQRAAFEKGEDVELRHPVTGVIAVFNRSFFDDLKRAETKPPALKCPAELFCGQEDRFLPFREAHNMRTHFKPVACIVSLKDGHELRKPESREAIKRRSEQFIRTLAAPEPGATAA